MTRYPESVDVAIVGSGPAGATYARILSEQVPDATIAMFEVGPTVTDPPGAHVKNIEDPAARAEAQRRSEGPGAGAATVNHPGAVKAGDRRARPGTFLLEEGYQLDGEDGLPVAAMSSNVGGMSAHWTGACPRPGGSEKIAFLPEIDELLDEAGRLLGVTTDAFDDAPFAEFVRSRLSEAVDEGRVDQTRVQKMPLAVHRRDDGRLVWSGSDVVLGDTTRANPNFSLFDESLVLRVLVEDGRAAGVEVRDQRDGSVSTVRARYVVVAADALRTPQVLHASGVRPEALGRYLNDQAQVVFAARIRPVAEPVEGLESTNPPLAELAEASPPAAEPPLAELVEASPPAAEAPLAELVEAPDPAESPKVGLAETSGVSWVPFTDDLPFHGQVMQLDASPVPLADDDPVVPGSIVGLGLFCAKDLQPTDRVEFSDTATDSYGMPAMRIHYTLTPRDRETIGRARDEIVRLGEAVGEPLDSAPFTMPLGSSLHYQGTTRMGEHDDGTSVADPDSQVWGVPGLFVAGNSVIPTATACNPTLTAVALAVGGARRIAGELAPSPVE